MPIFRVPNCFFVSLQHGEVEEEIRFFNEKYNFSLYYDEDVNPISNLDDFSSQIASLDLVISVMNATPHFSGALGVKTLTLLPKVPDWRWMYSGEYMLWYTNMRLIRQKDHGNWKNVFSKACFMLRNLTEQKF